MDIFTQTDDFNIANLCFASGADGVYLDIDFSCLKKSLDCFPAKKQGQKLFARLPLFLSDSELKTLLDYAQENKKFIDGLLCQNIGAGYEAVNRGFNTRADYMLYAFNDASVRALMSMGFSGITLSVEQNAGVLKHIAKTLPAEGIIYGRIALMQLKSCPKKNQDVCQSCVGSYTLYDRKNIAFPARRIMLKSCCVELLNSVPIVTLGQKNKKLPKLNSGRLILYGVAGNEVERVIKLHQKPDVSSADIAFLTVVNGHTAGHWFRGAI